MNQSRRNSSISKTSRDTPLFEDIPEYNQIITELSRGNLKGDFSKSMRRSKLSYDLNEILSGENNDELSYFVLFMDSLNASSYVKFLLDLKNFESLVSNQLSSHNANDEEKLDTQCECVLKHNQILAENTISIFSKYITKGAQYMIKLPSEIINQTIHNICPVNGKKIEPDCFKIARDYTFNILQSEFYDKYLNSEYHCKYILNILENRILDLSDILYDDIAVVYFLEYLEQENISDLLKFWIQAENFSRNILNFRECYKENNQAFTVEDLYNQWQGDAIVIYDNFISLQAKNRLGFDQFARQSVESNICFQNIETEELESFIDSYSNSFYVPMLIVYSILDKVYFKKFLQSNLFTKLINEAKHSSNMLSNSSNHKKDTGQIKKAQKEIKSDPLWARPQSGTLQFGKVDASGRYIGHDGSINVRSDVSSRLFSDITNEYDDDWSLGTFDQENPKKSSGSVLEKKIKLKLEKLINYIPLNGMTSNYSKTSSEDLEIAEQMAEMLVKEVQRDHELI